MIGSDSTGLEQYETKDRQHSLTGQAPRNRALDSAKKISKCRLFGETDTTPKGPGVSTL